ncbi:MAG: PAC2 family protein [Candidatus Parvarchaeota archaeon]|nr:PAC2 family protein [Candidatus Parvarchaeota archaeon]MCW1301729.1 PAC2 family protein [Candidatus Parvarchaeota archaeon]
MEDYIEGSRVIVAFPGIGSVSILAANYILKNMKHDTIFSIYSDDMPAILLNDSDGFRLPAVRFINLKAKEKTILCYGDSQPNTDSGAYKLSKDIIDTLKSGKAKEVIALGGIGIKGERKRDISYYMSNSKEAAQKLEKLKATDKLNERVNVIFGMTGLIYGMAQRAGLTASMLLVEANSAPGYMDTNASARMVRLLSGYLDLDVDLKGLRRGRRRRNTLKFSVEKKGKAEEESHSKEHYLG